MVHDLTANRDFAHRRDFEVERIFEYTKIIDSINNDLTSLYNELVLTGTTFDRANKQYVLDYKNMCDCCGLLIKVNPWDFENTKTLCSECNKRLKNTYKLRENSDLSQEVTDGTKRLRVIKPWDIRDFEQGNAVDDVFLWD